MHIERVTKKTEEWLVQLWDREWGGRTMISRGTAYRLDQLKARIAIIDGNPVGLVTWHMKESEAEIISLNALIERQGIGTALLQAAEENILAARKQKVVLVTSNDNLLALAFYQKRGYHLTEVLVGSIDAAREKKPGIPAIANNGIGIHDELVLVKHL